MANPTVTNSMGTMTAPASPSDTGAGSTNAQATAAQDSVAVQFMRTCAGCHTFGRGMLTGPDLITAATWPRSDLKTNIKRMEAKAGPLSEEIVEQLADFLKDPRVKDRLKAAEAEIEQQFAAKLEPASEFVGQDLFKGKIRFRNGGPACAACHSVDGQSRFLGPDLRPVHAKMGKTALMSAIEKSSFKIMEPAFRHRPVTRQEAAHLTAYLGSLASPPEVLEAAPIGWFGVGGATVFFVGMLVLKRRHRFGDRTPPQRRR